jgi:hypothetical protein
MKPTEQIASRASRRQARFLTLPHGLTGATRTDARTSRRARKVLLTGLASLSALAVLIALSATLALAERARVFDRSFGCAEAVAGCTTDPYPLASPAGVAVNESNGDIYVANEAVHDQQSVDVNATGGTFELVFENPSTHETKTTVPITFTGQPETKQAEEEVKTALENAGAGAGNVRVRGAGKTQYKIEFIGTLTGVNIKTMTAESGGLTGGTATATVSTTQAGVEGDNVEKFSPSGEFILMSGKAVNKTAVMLSGTEAEQDVCTALSGDVCGGGVEGSTPGAFIAPNYVSVDNVTGEVYVADSASGLVTKFTANGEVDSTWGDNGAGESANGQLVGPKGKPAEPFGRRFTGIAVDTAGNLWVDGEEHENQRLFEFASNSGFKIAWTPTLETGTEAGNAIGPERWGIAVDPNNNVIVSAVGALEYNPAGKFIGVIASEGGDSGVAVDASDAVFLDTVSNIAVYRSCRPEGRLHLCQVTEAFGSNHHSKGLLAVNSASPGDTLYVTDPTGRRVVAFSSVTVPAVSTGKPSGLSSTAATLNGTVNPSGVELKEALEGCRFEWGETTAYGHEAPCDKTAAQVGSGSGPVALHATVSGLQQGKTYHYRLVAANANDRNEPSLGGDVAFGPPLIESESAADVAATTATVNADIVPQNIDTRFRVEYGTSVNYGQSTPETDIGAAAAAQSVHGELQGLAPGTVYHYRFVAENVLGEGASAVVGPDHALTTQGAGGFVLPDSRKWEMVSPPNRHGSSPEPPGSELQTGEGVTQAAADGSGLAYLADSPTETAPAGYGEFDQIFAGRGPRGWSSHDLAIPHGGTTNLSIFAREYHFFSEDMSTAVVHQFGPFLPLSPWASEQTPYLNDPRAGGFSPLVTGCPKISETCPTAIEEHANVPPGTVFGQTAADEPPITGNACPPQPSCGPAFAGATPDGAHIVLRSGRGLLEGHGPGLYEWSGGRLRFVGAGTLGSPVHSNLGIGPARHAISSDGSRVVFFNADHLYMRDTVTEATVQLDVLEPGCPALDECGHGPAEPQFQGASSDGSRVFFTDPQKLTAQAGSEEAQDLYECEIVEDSCRLTALTQTAGVAGVILGASEDGSWVYFAARGVLGNGAEHGAVPGDCSYQDPSSTCNLYVRHSGQTKLVAVLATHDYQSWAGFGGGVKSQTARVSPNGRWLAFLSQRPLTGYDTRDAATGRPDQEVYVYDALTGGLSCASCSPTGARPNGIESEQLELVRHSIWFGNLNIGIAAYLPLWQDFEEDNAVYQPRYLSDSGRLFFNSVDALVPRDVNGRGDVYEYEPQGVGPVGAACGPGAASGSEVFKPAGAFEVNGQRGEEPAGCVSLISGGTSARESLFMDASEAGGDVFFLTASHLVTADVEGGLSVYDAHECTSGSPCLPAEGAAPPPCVTADACRQASTPPPAIYGAPASATFSGSGNVTPGLPPAPAKPTVAQLKAKALARGLKICHRLKRGARRASCEKKVHKRYGPARKANRSRSGGKGRAK